MARISGGEIAAKQLKAEGIEVVFNLGGDPMGAITTGLRDEGIRLIGFRHEQANALAAQAYGYALRRPAVAMVASGPAMTNAITAHVHALPHIRRCLGFIASVRFFAARSKLRR